MIFLKRMILIAKTTDVNTSLRCSHIYILVIEILSSRITEVWREKH